MNQIQKLTQAIRNCAECELDYGTLRTLKMIDDESIRMEKAVVAKPTLCDGEILRDIRRLCEIIVNNKTNAGDEAESLAMYIAHYPDILSAG